MRNSLQLWALRESNVAAIARIGVRVRCNVKRFGRSLMAKFVSFLFFILPAHCADVSLSGNANSESDLAGYRLHWEITSGSPTQHIDVGNVTTGTITGLETGVRYFITVTAYNTLWLESRAHRMRYLTRLLH